MKHSHALSLLFPCLLAGTAGAQAVLQTKTPPTPANGYWQLGDSFANAGDVDKDGVDDLIVGRPTSHTYLGNYMGSVVVYSGKTTLPIFSIIGSDPSGGFGHSVCGVGDMNLDGYDDFAVGAPFEDHPTFGYETGIVRVYSGKDAQLLHTYNSVNASAYTHFGYSMGAADLNLDGIPDMVIGAPSSSSTGIHAGAVEAFNGLTGVAMWGVGNGIDNANFGDGIHMPGDLNSDGRPDVLVYAGGIGLNTSAGAVYALNGLTGAGLFTKPGVKPYQFYGSHCDGVGDINNNGIPDFAIGVHDVEVNGQMVGAVEVYAGNNGALLQSVAGQATQQGFGSSVCRGADFNNDGFADYVAGIPDLGMVPGQWGTGGARLLSGKTGSILYTLYGLCNSESASGIQISMGPDMDGDGKQDIFLGGPLYSNDDGIIEVFSQTTKQRFHTIENDTRGTQYGTSVAILGDLNNDGCAEYIVGSPNEQCNEYLNAGVVRVISGKTGAVLRTSKGAAKNDRCGQSVVNLGDLNGDGVSDYAYSVPGAEVGADNDAGRVEVCSGKTGSTLFTINGGWADQIGWSMSSVGDLNNDGKPEFIIGAPFAIPAGISSGKALVCSGANGTVLYTYTGTSLLMRLGISVAGTGDVSGDGVPDFIIGAPGDPYFGGAAGTARVYSGQDGQMITIKGESQLGSQSGTAVSGCGDMNQDGRCEFAVGAPFYDGIGQDSGIVRVYTGLNLPNLYNSMYTFNGIAAGQKYGSVITSLGDINNDGRGDIAIGSPNYSALFFGQVGRVDVLSGQNGLNVETLLGTSVAMNFGTSIGGGGDIDGDGFGDIVVGAPGDDTLARDSGLVTAYSLIPTGIIPFAFGTPGCNGAQRAFVGLAPKVGNSNFTLNCSNTPANSLSLALVGNHNTVQPEDPLGVGCAFWVDLVQSTEILTFDLVSDNSGYAIAPAPIANSPALVGMQFYYQAVSYWSYSCPLGPMSLSTSKPTVIKIQP